MPALTDGWSVPLIVLTVLVRGFGLVGIRERVIAGLTDALGARSSRPAFAVVIAATVLLLTGLHALEGAAWAFAYVALGASAVARIAPRFFLPRTGSSRRPTA